MHKIICGCEGVYDVTCTPLHPMGGKGNTSNPKCLGVGVRFGVRPLHPYTIEGL